VEARPCWRFDGALESRYLNTPCEAVVSYVRRPAERTQNPGRAGLSKRSLGRGVSRTVGGPGGCGSALALVEELACRDGPGPLTSDLEDAARSTAGRGGWTARTGGLFRHRRALKPRSTEAVRALSGAGTWRWCDAHRHASASGRSEWRAQARHSRGVIAEVRPQDKAAVVGATLQRSGQITGRVAIGLNDVRPWRWPMWASRSAPNRCGRIAPANITTASSGDLTRHSASRHRAHARGDGEHPPEPLTSPFVLQHRRHLPWQPACCPFTGCC